MRRRGNKSHRVPNVKLRPAQAAGTSSNGKVKASSRRLVDEGSTCFAQETQDTGTSDPCPRPFKGVVLCATGIADKPTLFKQAMELGATTSSALTSRVTHLVATEHGSAKYQCAVERRIPILRPSWITDSYQVWLRGDDVDCDESMKAHRLLTFSGVALSFSGITDLKFREDVIRNLADHDGIYLENLERPVRITHILCSGDEETDKIRYARKFNQRGEANILLVWEEWFWDSLEFGGRFNEADYDVQQPRPQRRELTIHETQSSLPAMPESLSSTSQQDAAPPTPFDDEEEIACVAHRAEFTVQVWGSLLKKRGYEVINGKVIRDPSKVPQLSPPSAVPRADTPDPNGMDVDHPPKAQSVLSTFRRANSFAPVNDSSQFTRASQRLQPFRRTTGTAGETGPLLPDNPRINHGTDSGAQAGPSTIGPRGIFSGLKFRVLGEAKTLTVRNAIEQAGGIWSSEQETDEDVDYIIVRLVSGSKLYREELDEDERTKYRTECWLERCLHEERVCPYEEHIAFLPLGIQFPVAGTETIVMSFSGLDQSEICWMSRLLRALGIQLASTFSQRATHLLCPSGTGLKYQKAQQWNIPVVNREWLTAIATTGSVPQVLDYLVPPGKSDHADLDVSMVVDVKGKEKETVPTLIMDQTDVKGKGKEKEDVPILIMDQMDVTMNDITNDRPKPRPKNNATTHAVQVSRQPSLPQPPADTEKISFGQPKGLLGSGSGTQAVPHPITPSRKEGVTRQETFILDGNGLRGEMSSPLSEQQLQSDDAVQPPIPSSKTPSPMKIPQEGSTASLLSPMRIDQALQESVTSLLGKRQGEGEGGRNGKRSRPHRRPMSKESSTSSLNFDIRLASDPGVVVPEPVYDGGEGKKLDMLVADPAGESVTETGPSMGESLAEEKSMWVMYEDPGQVDERKRLMTLLTNTAGDKVSKVRNRSRRSTRLALAGV
ncbi:hypothetical protein JOM56_000991 [Amanita muscaria]